MFVPGYTEQAKTQKRVWHSLSFLPSLAGSKGKEERGRAEGGEREGTGDSSINAK